MLLFVGQEADSPLNPHLYHQGEVEDPRFLWKAEDHFFKNFSWYQSLSGIQFPQIWGEKQSLGYFL